jgi:hypothetical protein
LSGRAIFSSLGLGKVPIREVEIKLSLKVLLWRFAGAALRFRRRPLGINRKQAPDVPPGLTRRAVSGRNNKGS